jgi:hypothetical protein
MAKIFITGSADGLGQLAAKALIDQGHKVKLKWLEILAFDKFSVVHRADS